MVAQLAQRADKYSAFVLGDDYGRYVREMARPGTWGDHLTLQVTTTKG